MLDANTMGVSGGDASSTFNVPCTFTFCVRSLLASLAGGSKAARCTTASAPLQAFSTLSGSVMSPLWMVVRGSGSMWLQLTVGRSNAFTLCPASVSWVAVQYPRRPAPPVTSMVMPVFCCVSTNITAWMCYTMQVGF